MCLVMVFLISISGLQVGKPQALSNGIAQEMQVVELQKGKQGEDTLKYDGNNNNGIGLTSGGTFYGGVRFTPLAPCSLIAAIFYRSQSGTQNGTFYICGAGTDTTPGTKLDSMPFTATQTGWLREDLNSPQQFNANQDFWIVIKITNAAGEYPLGVDAGPMIRNRGGFISMDGNAWSQLKDVSSSLDYNWNIRAIVHRLPYAHDVSTEEVTIPTGVKVGTSYIPSAYVKNMGSNSETFDVECKIKNSSNTEVYGDTQTVSNLTTGTIQEVQFANWIPATYSDTFTITVKTLLSTDECIQNDTLSKSGIQSYEEGEIAYDDFKGEKYWVVNNPNGANDAFGVYFTPEFSPPFYVIKGKVYAQGGTSGGKFEYMGLFPGDELAPNLSSPYQKVDSVSIPAGANWTVVPFDTSMTKIIAAGKLWLVVKFLQGATGPSVGGDGTPPADNQSRWSNDLAGWHPCTAVDTVTHDTTTYDFMMRIVHNLSGAVEENASINKNFIVSYSTNPVRNRAVISYTVSNKMNVSIKLFDITGRLVQTLENRVLDKGTYEKTATAGTGVYFCYVEAGNYKTTKKLIFVR